MAGNTRPTIRRSYSIPQQEQERLAALPDKYPKIKPRLNKSEIIRLGVKLVDKLGPSDINKVLEENLERLKVGKPKKLSTKNQVDDVGAELEVTDKQWKQIYKLLRPSKIGPGKPKHDDRQVLNGILYIYRFDKQRRDVPEIYSSFSTCRRRLGEWRKEGLWQDICSALVKNVLSSREKKDFSEVLLRTWIIELK